MDQDNVRRAISGALARATTTREVVTGPGAMGAVGDVVAAQAPGRPVVVVADTVTWGVAGERVHALLAEGGHEVAAPVVLPGAPVLRPDTRHVATIRARLESSGEPVVPVAVGSGTINDLTKRAAHEAGLPYVVVATAASMDGYTASGAALVDGGVKQTVACDAPIAVLADLDVLCAAPPSMTAAGYGDLLGKVTAGADWIVADALGVEPIVPGTWEMVQGPLPGMLTAPERAQAGDPAAVEQRFLGLVLTGLAIQASGSSRCASGSEHQFSHLWEMRGLERNGESVSHGFKVAVGTLLSTALYERLLARDWTRLDVDAAVAAYPAWETASAAIRVMDDGPAVIAKALAEAAAKHVAPDLLRARLERFRAGWPELKARLESQLLPLAELRTLLAAAGGPVSPAGIGLGVDAARASLGPARLIRRRYTVFDLAFELGVFDELADKAVAALS